MPLSTQITDKDLVNLHSVSAQVTREDCVYAGMGSIWGKFKYKYRSVLLAIYFNGSKIMSLPLKDFTDTCFYFDTSLELLFADTTCSKCKSLSRAACKFSLQMITQRYSTR